MLESLRNSELGQTGVIVCSGPSLNKTDLSLLGGHPYILMNRGDLLGDKLPHPASALCVHDPHMLEQFGAELGRLPTTLLAPASARDKIAREDDVAYVNVARRWRFAQEMGLELHHGHTVTFWALQFAFHLGWGRALIVGMDHRFAGQGDTPSALRVRSGEDSDHFVPNYLPEGAKILNPNVAAGEYSYRLARAAWENAGRSVVDCTVDGACDVFPKSTLEAEIL